MNPLQKMLGQKKVTLLFGVLLLLNLLLFNIAVFPGSTPEITAAAPDQTIPDMMGLYSPEDVYDFLTEITAEGRESYQFMHLTTDLAFPLVYGLFLVSLLSRLFLALEGLPRWLPFLGLIPAGFDLAENFTLVFITSRFPAFLPGLTHLAQFFTLAKFLGLAGVVLLIVFLAIKMRTRSRSAL